MSNPVVVGVDGSPRSLDAVDLAAREATLRNAPLHLVYAYVWPYVAAPIGSSEARGPERSLRDDAEQIVGEAAERARATAPTVAVTGEAVVGAPTATLLERSRSASVVVIGDRGHGGFTGLLMGSVSQAVLHHAACPVAVVPYTHAPAR